MIRWGMIGLLFASLSAWVGATGPSPLTPVDRLRFFQQNRSLLEELVHRSLELTEQTDPLARVEASHHLIQRLSEEMEHAGQAQASQRVLELGEHIGHLLQNGVMPNFTDAHREVTAGSAQEVRLLDLRSKMLQTLEPVLELLKSQKDRQRLHQQLGQTTREISERIQPKQP